MSNGNGKYLDEATWKALKAAGFSDAELYEDQPTGPIIFSYTRKQAIEDGVLVDLTQSGFKRLLAMVGIKIHTAITATAFGQVITRTMDSAHAGEVAGNTFRLLLTFRKAAEKDRGTDRVFFELDDLDGQPAKLWAQVGPGDEGEPVITIMLEGED